MLWYNALRLAIAGTRGQFVLTETSGLTARQYSRSNLFAFILEAAIACTVSRSALCGIIMRMLQTPANFWCAKFIACCRACANDLLMRQLECYHP